MRVKIPFNFVFIILKLELVASKFTNIFGKSYIISIKVKVMPIKILARD